MNHPISFLVFQPAISSKPLLLPLFGQKVPAGFPSPVDDYLDRRLSLDEHLIPNKNSTFLVRARGNSMVGAGIFDGHELRIDVPPYGPPSLTIPEIR